MSAAQFGQRWEITVPMVAGGKGRKPVTREELMASEEDGALCLIPHWLASDVPIVARFTVDAEPASKARARYSPRTRKFYTPDATVEAEHRVAARFRQAAGPIGVDGHSGFGVYAGFFCRTGQRRDVDNMLKVVLDGLNKVAWADDSQVVEVIGKVTRFVSAGDERTEVVIYRTPDPHRPTKPCVHCGKPFEAYPSQQKSGQERRYCNRSCSNAARTAKNRRTCEHCQKSFQSTRDDVKFCSKTCAYAAKHVTLTCTQCGGEFTKAQSLARNAVALCSQECRETYWRTQRKTAAKGTCSTCGGPTSKKTYTNCKACAPAAARSTVSAGVHVGLWE